MTKRAVLTFAVMAALAGTHAAFAAGPAGIARTFQKASALNYFSEGRPTLAPFAQVRFCMQSPDECRASDGAEMIALDAAAYRELARVNASVNRSIVAVNDSEDLGDVWQVDVQSGDCEDFALTKRDRLIKAGWSPRALRIAVAHTPSGEGHAVLAVRTDRGDLVLDNRTSSIRSWRDTDLRWVKIQSGEDPHRWYEL